MKKCFIILLIIVIIFNFSACGSFSKADLTGKYIGGFSEGDDSLETIITDDKVEVYWNIDGDRALYYSGTYDKTVKDGDNYVITVMANKERNSKALLASNAESKKFTYTKDNRLLFEVSMAGVTKTSKSFKI